MGSFVLIIFVVMMILLIVALIGLLFLSLWDLIFAMNEHDEELL